MSLCLQMYRSVPRYLASRAVGSKLPGMLAGPVSPLRLVDRPAPSAPTSSWVGVAPRLSGICGSDLSAISGTTSFYFSALVSMPFTPGHEVVGELTEDSGELRAGQRVVLNPVLSCKARDIEVACEPCTEGQAGLCERVTAGSVAPGLQTGYCSDTSGGWSQKLTAHPDQLHAVPDDVSDATAMMAEPTACAIRAVRRAEVPNDCTVLISGVGSVGLLTLLALKRLSSPRRVSMVAKHPHQAKLAKQLGADEVLAPSEAVGAVRRRTQAFKLNPERSQPFLLGGVDLVFECSGSASGLDLALRVTKAGGKVVVSGMPGRADLSPLWFRELQLIGAYSGTGEFDNAMELAAEFDLGSLVAPAYPLGRWREAIDHALSAGSLGATKIAFDPRLDL